MNYVIRFGRSYPRWMWWFLDKYCRLFKDEFWSAARGEGWSALLYQKEEEQYPSLTEDELQRRLKEDEKK